MIKDSIIGLFPTNVFVGLLNDQTIDHSVIYQAAIDNFNSTLQHEERRAKWEETSDQLVSSNRNVLKTEPALDPLKKAIERKINAYAKEVLGSNDEYMLYITSSWFSYLQEGRSHPIHGHPNSIISGVYYVSANEDDYLSLYNQENRDGNNLSLSAITNEYNYSMCTVPVQNNTLIMFPATLPHSVPSTTKNGNDLRISLAFNTFVKGKLGDDVYANQLII